MPNQRDDGNANDERDDLRLSPPWRRRPDGARPRFYRRRIDIGEEGWAHRVS